MRLTADFSPELCRDERNSGMTYLKCWKKNIVKQEFYIQQNYSSKMKEKFKILSDKQKLREFVASKPAIQEMLKEVIPVKIKGHQTIICKL